MFTNYFINKLISDNGVIVTYRLLSLLRISIDVKSIKEKILEHPDHGSLLAVYDTLQSLNLDVDVFKVDKENINELSTPFIAQIQEEVFPYFIVVKELKQNSVTVYDENNQKVKLKLDDFLKKWTGISLKINNSNQKILKTNLSNRYITYRLIIPLILISISLLFLYPLDFIINHSNNSIFYFSYLILKILGLCIGFILLWYEIDKFNPVIKNLCTSSNKKVNCGSVLNSKASNFFGNFISLSEIGFAYFLSTLFFLLTTYNDTTSLNILATLSLINIPIILYSIIYQAFILKQWCVLCIFTQIILSLEVLLVLFQLPFSLQYNIRLLLLLAFFFLLPIVLFKILKPILLQNKSDRLEKRRFNKLKSNLDVFKALSSDQKKVSIPDKATGINFHNENVKYNVIKVCNPYCPPCSRAHPILDTLLNRKDISLKIIFTSEPNSENATNLPTFHFMAIKEEKPELIHEALNFWYTLKHKDYDLLAQKYPISNIEKYKIQVKKMYDWCKKEDIRSTPTIFINNTQLPKYYEVKDLLNLIS